MNEKLDLVQILKDCPKGTKFYSSYLGTDVFFIEIDDNRIKCEYTSQIDLLNSIAQFKKDGSLYPGGECMLFPSKDQRDWLKWRRPFVDGDVVYAKVDNLSYIIIYHKQIDESVYCHACLCLETDGYCCDKDCFFTDSPIDEWRLATEKEKQKLFEVLKDNGYKWNAETKTVKKLKKEKFDPKTLQPFDKVLVTDGLHNVWYAVFLSHINTSKDYPFAIGGIAHYRYCIPYNDDTKHLAGKSGEAPEFYKYWEE